MKTVLIIIAISVSLFGLYWIFRALRWLWREWIDVLHEYDKPE
jgi:hypothetical protein